MFWRDILSTLIGGLFVLIVAYTWAVLTGYLSNPGLWESVANFFRALTVPTGMATFAAVTGILVNAFVGYAAHRAKNRAEKSQKRHPDMKPDNDTD